MNITRLTLLTILAFAAIATGCSGTTTNTNSNVANANTAIVVNSNNSNGVISTTNTNTAGRRANYNANITREEYDKEKESFAKEAREAGDAIGQGATDGWLWVKTKAALATVDDLRDSTINVDVDNGVITLRGDVASADQVKKADAAAKGIEGKKSVQNKLKVAAGGMSKNTNATR